MSSVRYAHVVAQLLENKRPKGAKIILTPKPEDIVNNMGKLEQVPSQANHQEGDRLGPSHHPHHPKPSLALRNCLYCQHVLFFQSFPIPRLLG